MQLLREGWEQTTEVVRTARPHPDKWANIRKVSLPTYGMWSRPNYSGKGLYVKLLNVTEPSPTEASPKRRLINPLSAL